MKSRRPTLNATPRTCRAVPIQPMLPMITAPRVEGVSGVCSGVTRVDAGDHSGTRVYRDADVIMVMLFGSAVVAWWDDNKEFNRVVCRRHQHVHIPRGTPHSIGNPGHVPMLAVLVQSGAELVSGVELQPELDAASAHGQDIAIRAPIKS